MMVRGLQLLGMAFLPVAIVQQAMGRISVGQMLIIAIFGFCLFYLGHYLGQVSHRKWRDGEPRSQSLTYCGALFFPGQDFHQDRYLIGTRWDTERHVGNKSRFQKRDHSEFLLRFQSLHENSSGKVFGSVFQVMTCLSNTGKNIRPLGYDRNCGIRTVIDNTFLNLLNGCTDLLRSISHTICNFKSNCGFT